MKIDRLLDWIISPIGRLFERKEDILPLEGVDIVVGFGIGMRADGSPSSLSRSVATRCAELYEARLARMIVFTGGSKENGVTEAEAMKKVAMSFGVPKEAIRTENLSKNTQQNALNVWDLVRFRVFGENMSFAVVGQRLHAGRCYDALRRVVPKSSPVFLLKAYYPAYDPKATQKRLRAEWRFLPWEIVWTIAFRFKFVRRLIS